MQTYDFGCYNQTVEETEQQLRESIRRTCTDSHASLVFDALAIVRSHYGNRLLDDLFPAALHPMRVALLLANYDKKTTSSLLIAALLHDTLIYKSLTEEQIERLFGRFVAKLIGSVTWYSHIRYAHSASESTSSGWQEILLDSHEVRSITVFDLLDGMLAWKWFPADHQAQLEISNQLEEIRAKYLPLAHATNMQAYHIMRREYDYYVEQGYAHKPESAAI